MPDWNAVIKGMTQDELLNLASAVEQAKFSRHGEASLGHEIVTEAQRLGRSGPMARDPAQRIAPAVEALGMSAGGAPQAGAGAGVDPIALLRKLLQAPGEHHVGAGMRGVENLTGRYPIEETVDSYRQNPLASPWLPDEMRQTVRDIRGRKP